MSSPNLRIFSTVSSSSETDLAPNAQQAATASGGSATGSGGSIVYSIGQMAYNASVGTNGSVSQGVQQPYEISVVLELDEVVESAINLKIYPNPTNTVVNIDIPFSFEKSKVSIVDVNGRTVLNTTSDVRSIDVSALTDGVYMLSLELDDVLINKKIIIAN